MPDDGLQRAIEHEKRRYIGTTLAALVILVGGLGLVATVLITIIMLVMERN